MSTRFTPAAVRRFATSFAALAVFRLLLGAGEGGGFPAATRAMAEWFPVQERTRAMGIINTGSAVVEQFSHGERRVLLARGEAHFSVTKNPARPFIVRAGALQIRAVGTAFNINLQAATVDVVVTEGRVQLASGTPAPASVSPGDNPSPVSALAATPRLAPPPALDAGERAVLHSTPVPPPDLAQALTISRLDAAEMTRTLSWREPLLRLGGATLAELAVEFERATGRRLILADPALAELRFGGRFRSDDIDGFTHLLATTLDLDVERAADGTIVLRKKNSNSP